MPSFDIFTWRYKPTNLIEQQLQLDVEGLRMTVGNGQAVLRVPDHVYDADPILRERADAALRDCLDAALVRKFTPYELERSTRVREAADGSKSTFIESLTGNAVAAGIRADLIYTEHNGKVVDTKRARLEEERHFTGCVARHRGDETLGRLLASMRGAVENPANELVYFYDMMEIVRSRLAAGSKDVAASLGIKRADWQRLGRLCNGEPLEQSRHRGAHTSLVPATADELAEARSIAREIVDKYLGYLDGGKP